MAKSTKQSSNKRTHSPYSHEDKSYWHNQITEFKQSGLNRKAFCRRFDVNYDRFQYWYRKFELEKKHQPTPAVVPIKLTTGTTTRVNPVLCSIRLTSGATLYLHDMGLIQSLIKGAH